MPPPYTHEVVPDFLFGRGEEYLFRYERQGGVHPKMAGVLDKVFKGVKTIGWDISKAPTVLSIYCIYMVNTVYVYVYVYPPS
jgi:hypothetical protein